MSSNPSPEVLDTVDRIVVIDYYDGPTEAVVHTEVLGKCLHLWLISQPQYQRRLFAGRYLSDDLAEKVWTNIDDSDVVAIIPPLSQDDASAVVVYPRIDLGSRVRLLEITIAHLRPEQRAPQALETLADQEYPASWLAPELDDLVGWS